MWLHDTLPYKSIININSISCQIVNLFLEGQYLFLNNLSVIASISNLELTHLYRNV